MASQSGSAKSKQARDKQMASNLKARGEEREQGRCCICYAVYKIDRPQETFQPKVFDHIARHARGAE